MDTVVSGIRPTGELHLGNYFGAIKNFIKLQETHKCFFFIADVHSLTTHLKNEKLYENTLKIVATYLACGLDYNKVAIYRQSDVPEIFELYTYLNMLAYKGELERCVTFKEKAKKQPDNINAGLLTYPVLMTADIIIHKANKVPVGKDQEQHLEMARNFVSRFNRIFNIDFFPLPHPYSFDDDLIKIPALDGTGKMGKSENNAIYLTDDVNIIQKKVLKAVTDSGPTEPFQSMSEPIKNLFTFLKIFASENDYNYFLNEYNSCKIKYSELKYFLAEKINNFVQPIREKIFEFFENKNFLEKILNEGKEKARSSAIKTLLEVKKIIGFKI